MKVYVVVSESIIQGHQSNCLHGVCATKSKAQSIAISAIKSIAQKYYYNINDNDIYKDDTEFNYQANTIEIFASCIKQEVR